MRIDSNGKVERYEAVRSLVGLGVSYDDDHKGNIKITYHNGQTPVSDAEIDAELKRMQDEYDAQEYARKRQAEYPSIGDQMDMIYKDMKNGTSTHADAVEAVKSKYPKE